ncbi:MAG: DNA cytosine methyltransferase [Clostridiales Family XIII bacterium]|jgi:DNA (cytosine-5)-methyltransferase 1|nr:DNA cytosine methyltransferase [Clostridiales Family XIII bacterium]
MNSIEICAGAGGQALGLEQAGFEHLALVEIDPSACATLRENRPSWNIIEGDVKEVSLGSYGGIDLLAGGVPCPPFSVAGKQLGGDDDRDLFPEMIRLARECSPKAVMIENVKGIFDPKFDSYRESILAQFEAMGYRCFWELVEANHYGVPQQRTRAILVALKAEYAGSFAWPLGVLAPPPTVGDLLFPEMAAAGWEGAEEWRRRADGVAPTLVGGSKKHGGADLGPTRSRKAWEKLGVDGAGLADQPPQKGFSGLPRLTVAMAALLQGFPPDWVFSGKKTPAYRQVGNAFPPPVAKAVGQAIASALAAGEGKGEKQEAKVAI